MQQDCADPIESANILLVDDQPGKLLSYEVILEGLGQPLLKANSATEALQLLLKHDVAVMLIDVCMPGLDGFELAQMVREHPRFKDTAIIFVSATSVADDDTLRGYELGGVDYVSVPVLAGVLRAKVQVFLDLYLKTRALSRLNDRLEQRVAERTAELETSMAHQELLAREVDHRARNALAVIQSIVALTPNSDGAEFANAIRGRIRAMAVAHNLLSDTRWRGADLLNLVKEELAPYSRDGQVSIVGDAVSIAPTVAQSLALAVHELATNAAKYGALRQPGGALRVEWRLEGDELRLAWSEWAEAVEAPAKRGFGTKVIDGSIITQLRGRVERQWTPHGLTCTIRLPRQHFKAPEPMPNKPDVAVARGEAPRFAGRRILVVEDEPLVALMTSALLQDLGAEVVGPFPSLAECRRGLSASFDAALLDVNVAGELVYDFAEELRRRGAHIIFVTGYHASAIDARFAGAPVLTKPVERQDLAAALARTLGAVASA